MDKLIEKWDVIAQEPALFITFVVLVGGAAWGVAKLFYGQQIKNKDSTIETLRERLAAAPIGNTKKATQEAVDTLSDLLSLGIHEILNCRVKSDEDWSALENHQREWRERVERHLTDHFTRAEAQGFTDLGTLTASSFENAYNEAHNRMLMRFSKQEERLRDVIRRNQ